MNSRYLLFGCYTININRTDFKHINISTQYKSHKFFKYIYFFYCKNLNLKSLTNHIKKFDVTIISNIFRNIKKSNRSLSLQENAITEI